MNVAVDRISLVSRWYRDRDRSIWSDDAEWILPTGFPHGGHFRGKVEIFEIFFPKLMADWEHWRAECDSLFDSGDFIVGQGVYRGTFKATGRSVVSPFTHLFNVFDGYIDRHISYVDVRAFRDAQVP